MGLFLLNFFESLVLGGALLALLTGISFLVQPFRDRRLTTGALFYFTVFFWLACDSLSPALFRLSPVWGIRLEFFSTIHHLLAGPLLYLYFLFLLDEEKKTTWLEFAAWSLGLLPLLVAYGFLLWGAGLSPELLELAKGLIRITPISGAMALVLFKLLVLLKGAKNQRPPIINVMLGLLLSGTAMVFVQLIVGTLLTNLATSGLIAVIFIINARFPEMMLTFQFGVKKMRYLNSKIEGLDMQPLLEQVQSLMDKQQIYYDDSLSLNSFASELGITGHQLSELINVAYEKNFLSFINEYRIREVQKLLLDKPQESILSLGFTVGFNSNSAFYKAFQRYAGMSPGDFRKQNTG